MRSKSSFPVYLSTLLLFLLFTQMLWSAVQQSPTYDEGYYLVSGYAFVRLGDLHIRDGAPILLSALHALPLLELPGVRLPLDDPAWSGSDFHPLSEQFMWHVNANADQIIFVARVPAMLLTLLLAAFVGRWAGELFGPWGGLLALGLCALDPNIIAHGALAATDGGATALMLIATYWLWRWMERGGWRNLLLAGVLFGLAQCTRFSALLLAPIWALLWGWQMVRRGFHRWPRWIGAGLLVLLVAYLAIWAAHGLQIGPVAGKTSFPVPSPAWWEELFYIVERMGRSAQAFLLGELYEGGRWLFFPTAFALKTPIPTLILLLGAAVVSLADRKKRVSPSVWLPPLFFFALSLTSNLNLGYRYILPILPFLFVLAGRMGEWLAEGLAAWRGERRALLLAATMLVGGWSVWGALSVYPHYLAFFNEWAGGPDGGWRYLVDSNLDWGQGLKGLKRWMGENGVERLKLAYMGEAYPSYYGIEFDPLPSLPDRWQHPLYHDFYPHDPAPGVYAISATLLQGVNLADPDTFAWFRQREPRAKIGYSIFIYDVPKHGTGQAMIGLAGLAPTDIRPEDYALPGTNDVRVLWFDVARSLVFPSGGAGWWFVGGDAAIHPALARWQPAAPAQGTLRDSRPLRIWQAAGPEAVTQYLDERRAESPAWLLAASMFVPGDPAERGTRLDLPVDFERVELLGYDLSREMAPNDRLVLVTYWRVRQPIDHPLTLFVHLLDAEGVNRAGEDRCDVWHDNLQPGDIFAQVQEIAWNNNLAAGVYQVETGWYDPATMQRLPVQVAGQAVADRVLLSPVEVEQR